MDITVNILAINNGKFDIKNTIHFKPVKDGFNDGKTKTKSDKKVNDKVKTKVNNKKKGINKAVNSNKSVKGGNFLTDLAQDLHIKKVATREFEKVNVITDIIVFEEDYILDLKKKISAVSGLTIGEQYLFFENTKGNASFSRSSKGGTSFSSQVIIGHDYIIDGLLFSFDNNELLSEYKDKNNLLYKYRGVYQLDDYSYRSIKDILLSGGDLSKDKGLKKITINCLSYKEKTSLGLFSSESSELMSHYYKKFWPFVDNETVVDYSIMVKESNSFKSILAIVPREIIFVTKTTSFINKYAKSNVDLGQLMSEVNLAELGAQFCHLYKNKNVYKYLTKFKHYREFDRDGFNLFFNFNKVKVIITVYLSGKIRVITLHDSLNFNYITSLLDSQIPKILRLLKLSPSFLFFENLDITSTFSLPVTTALFNKLVEANDFLYPLIDNVERFNDRYTFMVYKNISSRNYSFGNSSFSYFGAQEMSVINQHTKILFKVNNLGIQDLQYVTKIITFYCQQIMPSTEINIDISKIKKNKRLLERDPVAYPKSLGWARLCQAKNQPIIFNEEEYNSLPADTKNKTIEYFNFTTEEPAYYYCPNEEFNFLSFKDVDGRACPCCQKREAMNEKKKKEYEEIIRTHVIIKQDNSNSRYETKYGKMPGVGRIIDLPLLLKKWLHKSEINTPYKLLGISQAQGILGCYMAAFGGNDSLGLDHYSDLPNLERFSDLVNTIVIKDRMQGEKSVLYLSYNKFNKGLKNIIIIDQKIGQERTYYPLYIIDSKSYNSKGIITQKLFDHEDPLVKVFLGLKRDVVFETIKENYDIVKIHTYKDIILYVLLSYKRKYVLLPLNNPILEIQPLNTLAPPDLNLDMPLNLLLEVMDNLDIPRNIERIITSKTNIGFESTKISAFKTSFESTKISAFKTGFDDGYVSIGFICNGLIYHHSPILSKPGDLAHEEKTFNIKYDLSDIYESISSNKPFLPIPVVKPKPQKKEIEDFRNKILSKVNTKIRNQIVELWKLKKNERLFKLYHLVDINDYHLLKECLSIEEALSKYYDFDNTELKKIMKMEPKDFSHNHAHDRNGYNYSRETSEYLYRVISNPLLFKNFLNKGIELYIKNIIKHDGEKITIL